MTPLMDFFSTENFMPHGTCIFWRPDLLGLYVGSDLVIGASYYSIPLALMYFASRRKDLMYRWVLWLFVLFILACGTTHFISIWTLWVPEYAIEGLVKAATAAVSVITAVLLWWIMPKALAIPSRAEIESVNRQLTVQVKERQLAESHVRDLNASLERRVMERTAELEHLNRSLKHEIAERREIEAKQTALLAELDHRVRNNLASILSMARATMRPGRPVEDLIEGFEQRLMAFSHAHSALSEKRWGPVSLRAVLEPVLHPYTAGDGAGVTLSGIDVELPPEIALTMGLVMNEIATNAAKYGALSVPQGQVAVTWRTSSADGASRLHLVWRERGGPVPARDLVPGFGTRFIEGSIRHKLSGTALLHNDVEGFVWEIAIPLTEPTETDTA